MRTKKIKFKFLPTAFLLVLLVLGTFLAPIKAFFAHASNGRLEIYGPDTIDAVLNSEYVEFVATLEGSQHSSSEIVWFYNDTRIDETIIQGISTNSSTLRLSPYNYVNEPSGSFATVSAKITNAGVEVYSTSKEVMIYKPKISVNISVDSNSQNFNPEGVYSPFNFMITQPAIIEQPISWFLKESNGKYSLLTGTTNTYSLVPTKPGTYNIVAKVGEEVSTPRSVKVFHQSISTLSLVHEIVNQNKLGFNVYKFSLEGITDNHDVQSINWYRKGYGTPLQYGGAAFVFEPTSYSVYQIYARYETTETESDIFMLEIKIDRTKDIVIFSSIIIGFMTIGLLFAIYRNIKKDKIW